MRRFLLPFSLACLVTAGAAAQTAEQKEAPAAQPTAPQQKAGPAAEPNAVKKGPWSADRLMDTSIRSPEGEELGEIEDLLVDDSGKIVSVVVETDSFLGMGGKYVLLPIEDLELTRDGEGNVLLKSNDKAKLESAPEYNYED
jgi:hypothetical protein